MKEFNIFKKVMLFSIFICFFEHKKNDLYDTSADKIRYLQKKSINFKNNRLLECANDNEHLKYFYESTPNLAYQNGKNYYDGEGKNDHLTDNDSNKSNCQYSNTSDDLRDIDGETTGVVEEGTDPLEYAPKENHDITNEATMKEIIDISRKIMYPKHVESENINNTPMKIGNNFLDIDHHHFEAEYNKIISKRRYCKLEYDNIYTKVLKHIFKYTELKPYSFL
ncbi:fam-b protein [Plasmodium vinckei]|uniref:Fam-b protein n=1 Tax=Plasmodium vinckei TaxID=5860 RepID=A0A6V7TGS2_PLAVN|nr:fam-b protein [Plasmodium vinckei]